MRSNLWQKSRWYRFRVMYGMCRACGIGVISSMQEAWGASR